MFRDMAEKDFKENVISLISKETMLITAGDESGYNTMTAAWGFMGEMWGKDCAAVVVRPQRYTMEFLNRFDSFTLSFFGDNKDIPRICGTNSGRDCDKAALAGLTPVFKDGYTLFNESRLSMVCRKLYVQRMDESCMLDKALSEKWYPQKDWHNLIIGSIERMYATERDA